MPITNEASVEIDRPIAEVFEYTNDNVAEWSLTVVEDTPLETVNGGGVGSTFHCVTEEGDVRMEFEGTVMKWEPPTLSAVELIGDHFDIRAVYQFEDLGGRTRVTQQSSVQPKTFLIRIMFLFTKPFIRKAGCEATEKELFSLKEKLEAKASPNER